LFLDFHVVIDLSENCFLKAVSQLLYMIFSVAKIEYLFKNKEKEIF